FPTEEGNSGSPVLDRQLNCFAVHHRALKEKQLNEGIALEAVIRRRAADVVKSQQTKLPVVARCYST
ncbi:MAG: hypothetical protein WBL96_03730, partial [Pseudolabrys sp.]